jgi:ribose 5-phosphate isomerase A
MLTKMSSDPKRRAAHAALPYLPPHGTIGLGSGSTAKLFIEAVAELVRDGHRYAGVPTSQASRSLAESLGIPLLDDDGPWEIDVCVDGADEVSQRLDLIKGGGGCHAREKIVNQAAKKNLIIVDASKLSQRLGERSAVPVEVLPFGHRSTARELVRFGDVELRVQAGRPWRTDSNNFIYDVRTGPLEQPALVDGALRALPGVVDTGLFCGRADLVLVADGISVRQLLRPAEIPST